METRKRRRKREWRAAGRKKVERATWLVALGATLFVIAVTLLLGHVRHNETPLAPAGQVGSSADASDE